jgi:hypothetical protein
LFDYKAVRIKSGHYRQTVTPGLQENVGKSFIVTRANKGRRSPIKLLHVGMRDPSVETNVRYGHSSRPQTANIFRFGIAVTDNVESHISVLFGNFQE